MVAEDDETSKDKEIDKLMALLSLSIDNVDRARENVGSSMVQKSRIQNYNCKEFGHVARVCQKPKRAKDVAYHREKMLLCKQEEAGIQLNAEQADWRNDTDDDELEDQELEAHYMYMAQLQEVSPDAADSVPIFDDEPLQKQSKPVHDTYPIEQDAQNVIIDSLDMSYDRVEIDQNDDDNDHAKECVVVTVSLANRDAVSTACENKIFVFDEKFPALDSIPSLEVIRPYVTSPSLSIPVSCTSFGHDIKRRVKVNVGFFDMHIPNVASYLKVRGASSCDVGVSKKNMSEYSTSCPSALGSSLRESSSFGMISINITSPSSSLVQKSSAMGDGRTNPSDSKIQLNLRTFLVRNKIDGSGGIEELEWLSGLSLSSSSFSLVLSLRESLCSLGWIVMALIELCFYVEHCGSIVSVPAIRLVMAFNTVSTLLVISLCCCLKSALNLDSLAYGSGSNRWVGTGVIEIVLLRIKGIPLTSRFIGTRGCVFNEGLFGIFHEILSVVGTTADFTRSSDFVHLGFFGVEVTKLTTCWLVNNLSCDGIDMVIKDLDLEPKDVIAEFADLFGGKN
uniref:CCHC-type domain-containing protein n=1 Tax=Tanacetum cinerariifolium TaxID=118510 RepID=A0A6L2M8Z4_TANCI|nr:hypothetical protein [Tanacetum cinerariifolium]